MTDESANDAAPFDWEAALASFVASTPPPAPPEAVAPLPRIRLGQALVREFASPTERDPRPRLGTLVVDETRLVASFAEHPLLCRLVPGAMPPDRGVHRALLTAYYGPHQDRLLTHLAMDPFYKRTRDAWRPGHPANLERFYALYDRLSADMGTIYGFEPAPLGAREDLPEWADGLYSPTDERIYITKRLLNGSTARVAAVVAHEQIHRFQHVQRHRLQLGRLRPIEASLAAFWDLEEANRPPGPGKHLGTEHQAYLLDREVHRRILSL